jgi:hypothetical protein
MAHEFKPIPSNPTYKCSKEGEIIGPNGNKMTPQKSGYGYCAVKIKSKSTLWHRLIAETWIPNPENLPTVHHINGNKWDNRVENLIWSNKKNRNYQTATGAIELINSKDGATVYVPNARAASRFLKCTPGAVGYWIRSGKPGPCKGWFINQTPLDNEIFHLFKQEMLTADQVENYINN